VSFDGRASSDSDGTISSYSWAFGDGASGSGATASHTYTSAGSFTATLTVTDNAGAHSSTSVIISAGQQTVDLHPPGNLTFNLSGRTVTLNWVDSSTGEEGFYIERCLKSVGEWSQVGQVGPDTTSFSETVERGTYKYRVRSFNAAAGQISAPSNKVKVKVR